MSKKRGQIWVETVIYTLIAFVMIGLVLYFAGPKIGEAQDKSIIQQSINIMEDINSIIANIGVPGNKRPVEVNIKKGDLIINGIDNQLVFEIESQIEYSEVGEEIIQGCLTINTVEKGNGYFVTLTKDYSDVYNITYQIKDEQKTLTKASTPYKIFISNKGGDPVNIDFATS